MHLVIASQKISAINVTYFCHHIFPRHHSLAHKELPGALCAKRRRKVSACCSSRKAWRKASKLGTGKLRRRSTTQASMTFDGWMWDGGTLNPTLFKEPFKKGDWDPNKYPFEVYRGVNFKESPSQGYHHGTTIAPMKNGCEIFL